MMAVERHVEKIKKYTISVFFIYEITPYYLSINHISMKPNATLANPRVLECNPIRSTQYIKLVLMVHKNIFKIST